MREMRIKPAAGRRKPF